MRPWSGIELMMVQGFSPDLKLEFDAKDEGVPAHIRQIIQRHLTKRAVTSHDLKQMAGNTMTQPIMLILQVSAGLALVLLH